MLATHTAGAVPPVAEPKAQRAVEQVRQALDEIESLCGSRARAGAHERLGQLEAALTTYLDAVGPDGNAPGDATPRVLWQLFQRLRGAVDAQSLDGVCSAAADLRDEFTTFERWHRAPALGLS